jgi:hypothetical protein
MNISASIDKLFASAVAVYKRFPLVLVFSSVVFFLVTSLIYEWKWEGLSGHRKFAIIWGVILAVPLYINFQLVREWLLAKWLWWLNLVLLLAIPAHSTYMLWYEVKEETEVYIQIATFIFVHGIVATTSCLKFREEKGFWQFNSLLLLNFINSSFYTAVISIGILAGFGLVNVLFKEFYGEEFGTILGFVATFFHPILFLAWLPNKDSWQEKILSFDLPKFFRTLIVFILIPLSIGYLLILYVYIANALALGELPKGTIGWTVLTFTVASVFALVLVYPYRKNEDQKLVYWFSRLLPFALSPLVVLLWLAIGMRVGDYGFTPSRVLLTLLAIWLTLINVYLYTGKKWGLMPLAGALTLLCVVAIGWPVNVKSISIWSQQSIQRGVLQANNIAEGDSVSLAVFDKLSDVEKEKLIGTNSFLKNSNSSLVRLDNLIPEYYYENTEYVSWNYLRFEEPENLSFLLEENKKSIYRNEFYLSDDKRVIELGDCSLELKKNTQLLVFKEGKNEVFYPLDTLIGASTVNYDESVTKVSKLILLKIGNTNCFVSLTQLSIPVDKDKYLYNDIRLDGEIFIVK